MTPLVRAEFFVEELIAGPRLVNLIVVASL